MLDVDAVRRRFPSLGRTEHGTPVAYLDGPAGTQVPVDVIEAMSAHLRSGTANLGGSFAVSTETAAVADAARRACADLLGAASNEIVFGQNMTSLTFAVSRAVAAAWRPGDEVVVTALDHDANITPWRRAAAERGATVRTVPFSTDDGMLDVDALAEAVGERTVLVAVTAASNALGSVTPLGDLVDIAHRSGALVYADAVHYSAHRRLDVATLGVDFVAASAYKFFGPHTGILYAREEHLEAMSPYKVVPAPDTGPEKWETGTQSFESLAGVAAAVDYLASLGAGADRRSRLDDAFAAIRSHEADLTARFLAGLSEMPGVRLFGVADPARIDDRVSTFALSVKGVHPARVAEYMAGCGINVWHGHYYAVSVMERLGTLDTGGLVRVGFVHYNTRDEVDRALTALEELSV
jgi:cysteine desulfurase family protein (TIGR01976 family)